MTANGALQKIVRNQCGRKHPKIDLQSRTGIRVRVFDVLDTAVSTKQSESAYVADKARSHEQTRTDPKMQTCQSKARDMQEHIDRYALNVGNISFEQKLLKFGNCISWRSEGTPARPRASCQTSTVCQLSEVIRCHTCKDSS